MTRSFKFLRFSSILAFGMIILVSSLVAGGEPDMSCSATPLEDRMPDIIAPMAGDEPIWLVDGSFGEWVGPEVLVKSVWVLSRAVSGDLLVRGRRLDGAGSVQFQDGVNGERSEQLVLSDLGGLRSVTPGGATSAVMSQYRFVMMYLVYPSPGCWEIEIRLGDEERRIVVEQVEPDSEG